MRNPKRKARQPATWLVWAFGLAAVVVLAWRSNGAAAGAAVAAIEAGAVRSNTLHSEVRVVVQNVSQPAPAIGPSVTNPHGDIRIACQTCHTAESWTAMRSPSGFEHATTGFELRGKHHSAACKDCHGSPVFARVATNCVDCHRDVHEGRNGLRCQDCHTPERWAERPDAVRRHESTSFPLRGVHAILECARCHGGQDEAHLTKVPSRCDACHSADYAATTNPNHAAAGYSTQCQQCHDVARATWSGASFDHAAAGFPLVGAHARATCTACHGTGTFTGLSKDCVSCHRSEYLATRDPNHQLAGFSTQCATCHNTVSWAGATFDHAQTRFPLTGAHRSATCTACHGSGQYTGTPTDCYACHRTQYEATSNPNHIAAGFNTQCTTCHSTNAWQPASFDHDGLYFRIYSGRHRGTWSSCTQCHGNPSSYREFSCFGCHAQGETDSHHREVQGYRYESALCYACHRNV